MKNSDDIAIDFYTTSSAVEAIVRALNGRHTGISGRNIAVTASVCPPAPSPEEWETHFHCFSEAEFSALPVGCRPDTVVVSNIPLRWMGMKAVTDEITPQLKGFFSQFGEVW